MHKIKFSALMLVAAVLMAAGIYAAATASDVVTADHRIPSSKTVSFSLSRKYTAQPLTLTVRNAVPNNGNVEVRAVHVMADGSAVTNKIAAIQLSAGAVTTNISSIGYVFPRESLTVEFSTATSGVFQVVGEVYNTGGR